MANSEKRPPRTTPGRTRAQEAADPMLIALALLGERDFSIPLTLLTGGCMITGRTIGKRQYIEALNQFLKPQENRENWLDLPGFLDLVSAATETDTPYLHLADVHVAGGRPGGDGFSTLWRIKMSEIDGFRFGKQEPGSAA